ncbi:WD repeat-containing protein 36 T-cell activation WD repeat-containing protein [Larimichthys crocea]|uniref:WD repeat-containing protein 36 T-cell activation WD repeat-containing protein n=1 Tax=Larimichthys crocea TaxID=215358 RepID=A0A0F8AJ91_LARCR|nr:WD repeat-containing protein 36 [Larimichthys crocea]KAE8285577.1 WD repeat-containing protein 36 T-cell activation WD repeat-containing protein [Larimichthys crocea]
MSGGGSSLFSGFRVLGLYSNHVPHALRYHKKHREFYVVTSVGKCFHTYNVNRLGIVAVSNSLPDDISCVAADRMLVFAATGQLISAFARNKEVVMRYHGHRQEVRLLLPLGDQLISADSGGDVIVWDVQGGDIYLRLQFDPASFDVSAMMHPSAYLNKVLLGSSQGALQLWNIKTSKLLFTFGGWAASVTALQQSPAVDVVGVGTATGRIIIHNIRLDETLMTFTQDWGPITSLAFRTDGPPIMASGSPQGHIAFWDLERRQLVTQQRHAHSTAVAAATFLHGEPLLVTNGADNAIKVWIFDQEGGGARLLRSRQGHSAPPTTIHHHGNDGKNILSAGQDGTLQSFSTVHERFNKNLGHGSINKKKEKKKKKGLTYQELRLPAITAFSSAAARQSDWDGIVACHRGRLATTTWNYQRCTMGAHHLRPPASRSDNIATAVDITSCGNFAVIGSSCGRVDVYNLQSGLHRGCYGDSEKAHSGALRGVATDALNQLTLTTASDWLLKFWHFKTRKQEEQLKLNSAPASMKLHRDSGMLALALDDFTLLVVDIETRRVVRKFAGHHGNINDMTFSPDGRWLVTAAMDCTIRTWDLPSGCLVDCFLVSMAAVGVSLSPTGDFLATAHVDSLGVYLWTNKSLCGPVGLHPLPADYQPTVETLPGATAEESEQEVTSEEVDDVYKSADQLGAELVTLSQLPESRWKSLLHLEAIKRRNKPVAPPAAPAAAPFFLPTVPGLMPRFTLPVATKQETQSKLLRWGSLCQRSEFSVELESALSEQNFDRPLRLLKDCGPAALSIELASLTPEGGGANSLLFAFIHMIDSMLSSGRDFDLAHAYLALFLKLHLRSLSQDAVAMAALCHLSSRLEMGWAELRASFDQSLCLLSYTKSALL